MKNYSIEEQAQIGKEIANILCLCKDRKGRYKTAWGNKTEIGIYNMIKTLAEKIQEGGIKNG